jgi:hypothetical protein
MIVSHTGRQAGTIGRAARLAQSAIERGLSGKRQALAAKLPDNAVSNPNEAIA